MLSVAVMRELNRIPSATIQLWDGEASKSTFAASNTDIFIPGKQVEIQLGYHSQNDSVFKGIIIKHSIKIFFILFIMRPVIIGHLPGGCGR